MPWEGVVSVLGEIKDHGRFHDPEMVLETIRAGTCTDLFQESQFAASEAPESSCR